MKRSLAGAAALVFGCEMAMATSQNWDGGASIFWTNNVNWSSDTTYPSGGDTATFNTVPTSNRTNVNVQGLSSIKYITFDTYNVSAYVIGTNVVNDQTLVMAKDGEFKITASAANSQIFKTAIQLGPDRDGGGYTFRNDNPSYALSVEGNLLNPGNGPTINAKTVNIYGVGNVRLLGNMSTNGTVGLTINDGCSGTLTLSGSNVVNLLKITGSPSSVIDIGDGFLWLDNLGANTINATQNAVINGTGKIRLSTNTGHNYADNFVDAGKTLVINPSIVGPTGFEMWSGTGTFVFNGINTFESNVIFGTSGTISVSKVGNKGSTTSNLGQGVYLRFTAGGRLLYTGAGEVSDRTIQMENNMTLDQSGTGTLNFSAPWNVLSNTKTLTLQGSGAGIGEISGTISNGTATTSVTKGGTGLWRLSGTNSFLGAVTVNAGTLVVSGTNAYTASTTVNSGTLVLTGPDGAVAASGGYTVNLGGTLLVDNTFSGNNPNRLKDGSGLTLNGGTLRFENNGGATSYSETVGALTVGQNNNTVLCERAAAGQASTLTFASLSRTAGATVNFVGEGLGNPDNRNRILFTAAPTLGPWATVNGTNLAAYSASLGIYASAEPAYNQEISALGPSTIYDVPTDNVRISSQGSSGDIVLNVATTRIAVLKQDTVYGATVKTAGQTFRVGAIAIPQGKAAVTVGAAPGDGTMTAAASGGDLALANDGSGALTVNAVVENNTSASTLTKMGAGNVALNSANTFSGVTTIGGGTLTLANSGALQSSTLSSGGVAFDASVPGHAFTIGGLSGSFPLDLDDNAGVPNPVALSVGNNNANVTHSGVLSGAGSLTKIGTGTQTLTGSNTLSGVITISQGTLAAGAAGALGAAPVVNNATLNLTAGSVYYTGLSAGMGGTGTVNVTLGTGSGTATLPGDYSAFTGTWNIGVGAAAGAAKAYMNGADNSAATVNVLSNATLYCNAGTHAARLVLKGGDTGESYGQLRLESNANWAGPVTLAGTISSSGDGIVGSQSGNGYISGVVSDLDSIPRPFTKMGAGTIILSNTNTFKGQAWIREGTLRINSITNVGGACSALGAPATVSDGVIRIGNNTTNGVLAYFGMGDVSDRVIDLAGTTGSATLDQSGTNALVLTGGMIVSGTGSKTLTLQGSTVGTGEFAGIISNGVGSMIAVVKAGSGTWTLSNANTYTNGTQIKDGGTLVAAHPNALGTGPVLFPNLPGTLDLANDGAGETPYEVFMQAGAVGTIRSNRGTPGEGLNHNLGTWHLSAVTVNVTNGANVTSGTPSITAAYLDLYAGSAATTILYPTTADLIITGGASILGSAFAKTLQLDGTSTGSAILGPISNGLSMVVSLTKTGPGLWTLCGSNTYSGATAVNNGRIVLAGPNGALLGAGGLTLSQGTGLKLVNSAGSNNVNRLHDTAAITLNGATLEYAHDGGATNYSETAGTLSVSSGSNTLITARAADGQTSTVTFVTMTRSSGTINFVGDGLGADMRNRVLFSSGVTLVNGLIGPWAMINGSDLATYDATAGVTAYAAYSDLAARGPDSVITNSATLNARINQPGVDGAVTLQTSPVSQVYTLLQNTLTDATVTTTNTTFQASAILVGAGKANLKIGAAPGDGALTALSAGGQLALVNNDSASLLTVNAPVTNNGSACSLLKSGVGEAVLQGSNAYSGATLINEGTLTFGGGVTQTLAGVVSGPGKLKKSGTGRLILNGANTYLGETYINEGVVVAQNNAAFGSASAGTFIADGATLDLASTLAANALNLGTEVFTVSGSGVNGLGAIVNSSPTWQLGSFGKITLAGDTTVGAVGRWDIRNNTPTLTLNGHTLTKIGTNEFCIVSTKVIPDGGHLVVTQGLMRLESSTTLNGDASDTLRVKSGARLDLYNFGYVSNAAPWTLLLEDLSSVTAGAAANPYNTWWGPVTLFGTTFLDGGSGLSAGFSNAVSGASGSLVKNGSGSFYLFSDSNSYGGTTVVSNGNLYARYPGSLPGFDEAGRVKVGGSGTLVVYYGEDGAGWTKAQIDTARTNTFYASNTACLGIDTAYGNLVYDRDIPETLSIAKFGVNALTLPMKNLFGGQIRVYGGTVNLPATSTNALSTVTVNGGSLGGTLNIDGYASLGNNNMNVGSSGNDRSIVTFSTNANMAKLLLGTTKGASGAVIQNGGDLKVGHYIVGTDVTTLGSSGGYGYYRLNHGSLTTGQLGLTGGGAGNNDGVFELYDGSVSMPTNNGWLIWGWTGGNGVLNMFGGTLSSPVNGNDMTFSYQTNCNSFGMLNLLGPAVFVDSTGQNTGKSINMARCLGNIAAVINVNGGTLLANRIYATTNGTPTLINFNGGKLRVNGSTAYGTSFMQGLSAATVYPGGVALDTSNANVTVNQSLAAPVGLGVAAVPLRSQGLGYIGAPTVVISGGKGTGATAIATVDLNEASPTFRQVTGITVTSPGSGYQFGDSVSVVLRGGGYTNNAAALAEGATLGLNRATGGLTKLGTGVLTLGATNTYGGATVISNGVLKLGNAQAVLTGTEIVLAGGTLDLNGFTVTNELTAISGAVTNGTIFTELSPAGTNTVGTETVAFRSVSVNGKYLVDVAADGSSDLLTVQSSLNLGGLALEIVNPGQLNRDKVYTIATVSGVRTGTFSSTNLPDSRWHLFYGTDGSVKLVFVDGTLLFLR